MSALSLTIAFVLLAMLLGRRMWKDQVRQRVMYYRSLASQRRSNKGTDQGAGSKEYKYQGSTRI